MKILNETVLFKILYQKRRNETVLFHLKDFLTWKATNIEAFCGPKAVTLCMDEDCLSPSLDENVKFQQNPSIIQSDGKVDPTLSINLDHSVSKVISILASIPSAIPIPITNVVKGIVVVCGEEKVTLADTSNRVFNIKDKRRKAVLSYPLTNIWKVDTNGLQ